MTCDPSGVNTVALKRRRRRRIWRPTALPVRSVRGVAPQTSLRPFDTNTEAGMHSPQNLGPAAVCQLHICCGMVCQLHVGCCRFPDAKGQSLREPSSKRAAHQCRPRLQPAAQQPPPSHPVSSTCYCAAQTIVAAAGVLSVARCFKSGIVACSTQHVIARALCAAEAGSRQRTIARSPG